MGRVGWLYDHVVGFRHANAKFIRFYGLHWLAVSGNNRHRESRDTDIEEGHRRGVDESQANFLAGTEQPGPVAGGRRPVHQVGIFRTGYIQDIPGTHSHSAPHAGFAPRGIPAHGFDILEEVANGALVVVVVALRHFQIAEHVVGRIKGPVGEDHNVFAIVGHRFRLGRINDNRPIMAQLFLKARVAVVPVGAVLFDRKTVLKRFAGHDAGKADARNAVHLVRQNQTMPVNGCCLR